MVDREQHSIFCICAFIHGYALFLALYCGNRRIQGVAVPPFCGRREEEVGDGGNVLEEQVSVFDQWPFEISANSLLRFPPATDHAKVRKPLLAWLASSLHRDLGQVTLVKSLGSTRESYGSFRTSISSSLGSGFSGLRIKGRLNRHPHTAQYFSLVNMTLKDLFHFWFTKDLDRTLVPAR